MDILNVHYTFQEFVLNKSNDIYQAAAVISFLHFAFTVAIVGEQGGIVLF